MAALIVSKYWTRYKRYKDFINLETFRENYRVLCTYIAAFDPCCQELWSISSYESDKWSSQWISNLSKWNKEAWKKNSGLQRVKYIPLKPWIFFFRLLYSNCLNWKFTAMIILSLSYTSAVHVWIISYTLHNIVLYCTCRLLVDSCI